MTATLWLPKGTKVEQDTTGYGIKLTIPFSKAEVTLNFDKRKAATRTLTEIGSEQSKVVKLNVDCLKLNVCNQENEGEDG